jgi:PncC family amidohydrolase
MKNAVLGISMKVLKQKGAVCSEVADAMATAALKLTPADVAIAVTGVAGPEPDEDGNPVGLVFCSAARSNRRTVTVRHFFEDLSPDATIKATIEEALTLLEQCCQC